MMKAHTLGAIGHRVARVEVFASAGRPEDGPRTLIRGFDVELEPDLVERLRSPLRLLGIPIDGTDKMYRGDGVEVDVLGEDGATLNLIPRSSDLAIAVSIAAVQSQESSALRSSLDDMVLLGELGAAGELLPVKGALPLLVGLGADFTAIVPRENGVEAARAGVRVLLADTLEEVLDHLRGKRQLGAGPEQSGGER